MQLQTCFGQWFALHVRPRAESFVAMALGTKGYESFLPTCVSPKIGSNGSQRTKKPLFPGYLFCRFDAPVQGLLMTTPGIIRIVGCGSVPATVDESEILALKQITESGAPVTAWPALAAGDKVRIISGPLSGMEGVLFQTKKRDHFAVSVTLLQRSALVEVRREWVVHKSAVVYT